MVKLDTVIQPRRACQRETETSQTKTDNIRPHTPLYLFHYPLSLLFIPHALQISSLSSLSYISFPIELTYQVFTCGATLVGPSHAITAAHCIAYNGIMNTHGTVCGGVPDLHLLYTGEKVQCVNVKVSIVGAK